MFAILTAISEPSEQNIVIFIDSQAAIQTIFECNLYPPELESECKQRIDSFLCSGREVVLQWISGHCGIYENERADMLAREASALHPPSHPVPLRNARRLLKSKFRHRTISDGKSWAGLLDGQQRSHLSLLPRAEGVACLRIITGHDYLQARLFKITLVSSPLCVLCNTSPMTGEHLLDCPSLLDNSFL
nr:uncharacterized protein LOC122270392 [Parasteatoda tepidariorum]